MEEDVKPIIVTGVDVSKCEFLTKTGHCRAHMSIMGIDTNKCKCFPNCHFKQLKRKEQEYEELRQYHNKCCTEFENEKQALLEKYNQVSTNFYNGDYCNTEHCSLLKAKEQECEELKEQFKLAEPLYQSCNIKDKKINKYKQQLDQLKAELEQEKALKETYLTCYKAKHEDIDGELFKLKQTLTEIKEYLIKECKICKEQCAITNEDCADCQAQEILQKISEVENA